MVVPPVEDTLTRPGLTHGYSRARPVTGCVAGAWECSRRVTYGVLGVCLPGLMITIATFCRSCIKYLSAKPSTKATT